MNDKKETILMFVFVVSFLVSVIFMCTSRDDVYDNGHGADKVRNELEHAQAAQQEETRAIDETEKAITRGKERVDESTRTNKEIADTERADAEIVDECQQILKRVRERKATGN